MAGVSSSCATRMIMRESPLALRGQQTVYARAAYSTILPLCVACDCARASVYSDAPICKPLPDAWRNLSATRGGRMNATIASQPRHGTLASALLLGIGVLFALLLYAV